MNNTNALEDNHQLVEASTPSTEHKFDQVPPTTSPENNTPVVTSDPTESSSVPPPLNTPFSEDMRQWLSANKDDYELFLLHALLHTPQFRLTLLSLITPDDFAREEYALVVGAMTTMSKVMHAVGKKIQSPPSPESMRTYIKAANENEGFDDETIQTTIELIQQLQDTSLKEMHYCISPYFEAWYGSIKAKKAARRIMKYYIPDVKSELELLQNDIHKASQIDGFLNSRKFDFESNPEEATPLITFKEHSICTPGNIVNIQGPPKSCKSGIVSAILAKTLHMSKWWPIDSLGFNVNCPTDHAILHFDTEQSEFDHVRQMRRAYKRARRKENANWFHSYRFTGLDSSMCWSKMQAAIYEAKQVHQGISLLIIDGIADFCNDPNDSAECFELVRKLHELASDHNCGVVTVLHQNPGSPHGKTRGHLGSQIERKAETSLRVEKGPTAEVFQVWADSARSCHIPKAESWRFHWSDEEQMHVTLPHSDENWKKTTPTAKPTKEDKYPMEVRNAFGKKDVLSYTDLVSAISRATKLADSTAKTRIPEYVKFNLIEKTENGEYQRTPKA